MRTLAIVRAYDEEVTIAAVVNDIREHMPSVEIVVIDDGSHDTTAQRAREAGARVERLPVNQGMGAAAQAGYRIAAREGFDFAIQVDGDGQHPGKEAARVLQALYLSDADVMVGTRFATAGGYRSTFMRRVGIRFASGVLTRLLRCSITDATSGLRAVGRRGIELFAERYPSDYVELESLLVASRNGLVIGETPVTMRARPVGRSTITPTRFAIYGLRFGVSVAVLLAHRVSSAPATHA